MNLVFKYLESICYGFLFQVRLQKKPTMLNSRLFLLVNYQKFF